MTELFSIEVWMVALAVTVAVLTGFGIFVRWCAFSPAVPAAKLETLRVGMTTEEVISLLGEPRERKRAANGSQQWTFGPRVKRHVLIIEFAASNKLQSFAHGVPVQRRGSSQKNA